MHRTIETYNHDGRIAAMVELECHDDFAAKTDEFRTLARHIAMHIAAAAPTRIEANESAEILGIDGEKRVGGEKRDLDALLEQAFATNPEITVGQALANINEALGEQISIVRFTRYETGET